MWLARRAPPPAEVSAGLRPDEGGVSERGAALSLSGGQFGRARAAGVSRLKAGMAASKGAPSPSTKV